MPANALFLAMDNFFCQIVNFSEQSLVRKVAVAYFATIAERQTACRDGCALISPHTYLPVQEWAGLRFDPDGSNTIAQPQKCVLEIRNRLSDLCEHNRCAGTYPTLTPMPMPMFKRDACGSY